MILFFNIGWVLLILSFFGAAAEIAVHAVTPVRSVFISGNDVWYVLAPNGLALAHFWVESHLGAAFWDVVIRPALTPPLWLTFGLPGFILLWRFRPRHGDGRDAKRQEEALGLYDELARDAKENGYGDGDDMMPGHDDDAFAHDRHDLEGDDVSTPPRPPAP
ncbi:hypothetical protein [Varunaivibrio sulfuroxidans]|uniref:Uncharacterized protein n=1 Tax=Varunaivibrio sulfuroxidans TaxID=1773489 RepID=A0A4R3JF67_9PROT|nr:hypothetical protein [Varunaivibrio sulfuroxidans]TCS64759.1 hypothetical protein EDD55_10187 [Varunaivibrio sulfuroxidans]WES29936.1 hypothetical protein P3M64_09830 [Varunaivibrio sulfuroxidans]